MLPKVEAACDFAGATGRPAVIGALSDIEDMLAGTAGTQVTVDVSGAILAPYPPEATR
jgi:carbamate kinase